MSKLNMLTMVNAINKQEVWVLQNIHRIKQVKLNFNV